MKRIFFLLFFVIYFFFPSSGHAQDTGWIIDLFDARINILSTGEVSIQEKINVDFYNLSKHGIYRDIPYVYKNEDGSLYYTEIDNISVLQNGSKAKFEVISNDANIRIKIGDPNKTVSSKNSYEISYIVRGVLKGFDGYDEFYWNVTGDQWGVPINSASSQVFLEKSGMLDARCYQGYSGSSDLCFAEILEDSKTADFNTNKPLDPSQGMTAAVSFKKNLVPLLMISRPKTFLEKFLEFPSIFTMLSVLGSGAATVFFLWIRYGRDMIYKRKHIFDNPEKEIVMPFMHKETIVVEYIPPDKLSPAEMGVLVDERADTLDIVSTIIDLAGRGYLSIKEIPKSWMFGSTDYQLIKSAKAVSGLASHESLLMDKLFDTGNDIKISDLKMKFYSDLSLVKKEVYKTVVAKKFFPNNPENIRGIFLASGIVLSIIGFASLMGSIDKQSIFFSDIAAGILASGVIVLFSSPFMSRRTGQGRELYRRVKGYRLFISHAEKYRQRFFEKKNLFNDVLPYAIMFGLTDKFAQAMKDIGLPEKSMNTGWYVGSRPFNTAVFASNINSFSSSLSSAMSSTPKNSGSSGGGSSGGGFGGGGGGSW